MRSHWLIMAVAAVVCTGVNAQAQAPAAPSTTAPKVATAAPRYTTEDTDIGTLLDDPDAKAVLAKHLPEIVNSDQIDMARSMTLKVVQQYSADQITDAKLTAIDADLAKLPPKK